MRRCSGRAPLRPSRGCSPPFGALYVRPVMGRGRCRDRRGRIARGPGKGGPRGVRRRTPCGAGRRSRGSRWFSLARARRLRCWSTSSVCFRKIGTAAAPPHGWWNQPQPLHPGHRHLRRPVGSSGCRSLSSLPRMPCRSTPPSAINPPPADPPRPIGQRLPGRGAPSSRLRSAARPGQTPRPRPAVAIDVTAVSASPASPLTTRAPTRPAPPASGRRVRDCRRPPYAQPRLQYAPASGRAKRRTGPRVPSAPTAY